MQQICQYKCLQIYSVEVIYVQIAALSGNIVFCNPKFWNYDITFNNVELVYTTYLYKRAMLRTFPKAYRRIGEIWIYVVCVEQDKLWLRKP